MLFPPPSLRVSPLFLIFTLLLLSAGTARAQSFSTPTNYVTAENPNSGVAGDFNGDGKLDLAVANVLGKNVSVYLNNGNGSFGGLVHYAVDFQPESIAMGDFNGDGKLDLVTGNFFGGVISQGSISILLGNGNGTFQGAVNFAAGTPAHVAVADLNADNKLDVVAASHNTNKATVLLGNGDGTFQTAVPYTVGTNPLYVAIADYDGDSKPDLAVSHMISSHISILIGNGDGTFQTAVNHDLGTRAIGILASDLNGDSKQDLIAAGVDVDAVLVLLGNGNGTFQAHVSYPTDGDQPLNLALADFNGDSRIDVVAVNANFPSSYTVLRGVGDGTFLAADSNVSRNGSWAPIVGDFDADGKPDLGIANNVFDLVDVYLNSPSARPVNITATQGVAVTAQVATFIDYDTTKTAGSFTAMINWGDGTTPTSGTIAPNASGGFNVTGTHTYAASGVFNVTTQIADSNDNFARATSTATVKATTTTAVISSLNPSNVGQTVTFTAQVTSSAGTPTGSVQFKDNGTNLGTAMTLDGAGAASVTTSALTAGTHTITAEYSGATTFLASTGTLSGGQVVRALTTTAVTSSVNPSDFTQSVTFTATVTSSGGTPAGSVQFKDNGTNLGTAVPLNVSGVATLNTPGLTVGTHTITAEYSGSTTFAASSGTLSGGQVVRPVPTLSINDVSTSEGDSGTKTLTFTVTLSAASNLTVTANFATADSSATAGSDYQATSGGLTFNPGDTTKTVVVTINGDTTNESDETFLVNLSTPSNATLSDSQGVGTIVNDDAPLLLIDETTGRALALDAMIPVRDPFTLTNPNYFSTNDLRRRVSLFVWRLGLLPSDTIANLTVTAEDGLGGVYTLAVESMGAFTAVEGVTYIIVRLPDNVVGAPRDLSVKVQLRGPASNSAIIKIAP